MGNLETLNQIFAGWARGDFTAGVPVYAEDVVLVIDPEFPESGLYEGPTSIRDDYMRPLLEAFDGFTIRAESFEESGDRILVKVTQSGVGSDSGVPVEIRYFQLFTFRDGLVARLQSIMHADQAREALATPSG